MIKFDIEDFSRFTNLADSRKYYYYAEKQLPNYVIEINAGMLKKHFIVEIKNKNQNVLARGSYTSLERLNRDLNDHFHLLKQQTT